MLHLKSSVLTSWMNAVWPISHMASWIFVNTLGPRQNVRHFPDDTFKRIFLNENIRISIKISLKFVPKVHINNIPALVQIMAWCRPGDKPLSETVMVRLPTHICVTRLQWVNIISGKGLSPFRHKAISRNDVDFVNETMTNKPKLKDY